MRRYQVQCVDRVTGTETPVLVDATSAEAARAWAIQEGHMVGRVADVGPGAPDVSPTPAAAHAEVTARAEDHDAAGERQAMIDAARQWQRQRSASGGAGGQGFGDTQKLVASLEAIASSPIITHPRRTLLIVIIAASLVTTTISQIITLGFRFAFGGAAGTMRALSNATPTSADGSGTLGAASTDPRVLSLIEQINAQNTAGANAGVPTASPEQVEQATKQIEDLKKLYEDTANDPMGDKERRLPARKP